MAPRLYYATLLLMLISLRKYCIDCWFMALKMSSCDAMGNVNFDSAAISLVELV